MDTKKSNTKRKIIRTIGVYSCIFLVTFLGINFFLGAFLKVPSTFFYNYDSNGYLWNTNKSGLYSLIPGGIPLEVEFNKSGERDNQEHLIKKSEDVFRIVLFGASTTFGWPVAFEDSYPQKIKKYLEVQMDKEVEIINCAVINTSLVEHYEVFEKRCGKYEAIDLVIVQATISDRNQPYSLFFGEQNTPFITEDLGRIKQFKKYFRPHLWGYEHFPLMRLFEYPVRQVFGKRNLKPSVIFEPQNEIVLKLLKKWKKELLERGTKLLVVNIPVIEGMHLSPALNNNFSKNIPDFYLGNIKQNFYDRGQEKEWGEAQKEITENYVKTSQKLKNLHQVYQGYLEKLKAENISTIDFLTLLSDHKLSDIFIMKNDMHLNGKGYDLVGKIVANFIVENLNE